MIKLKDLLLEGSNDVRTIAQELLRIVRNTKSHFPKGLGGIEVAWDTKYDGVFILFDTPREVRHPRDYDMEGDPSIEKWHDFGDVVFDILQKFEKKYKGIEFGVMKSVSGPGVKVSGVARSSHL